ncbi:hypothetical protein GCM10027176_46970 [Actinoallomurus bryophytorum]
MGAGEHVGVAWNIRDLPGGGRAVGHAGLTRGYAANLTVLPDSGRAFVVLANSELAGPALAAATDAALGLPADPRPAYVRAPDARAHLGVYTDEVDEIRVDAVGDGVVLAGADTGRVRFVGPDEGRGEHGLLVRFIRDGGEVAWLRLGGRILRKI